MAICDWCQQEMLDERVTTCKANTVVVFPDKARLPAVPYGVYYALARLKPGSIWTDFYISLIRQGHKDAERCSDCSVGVGGYHHPGCDKERCPRCEEFLFSCGCLDDEEE